MSITTAIIISKRSLSQNIEYDCIEGDKVEGGFFLQQFGSCSWLNVCQLVTYGPTDASTSFHCSINFDTSISFIWIPKLAKGLLIGH